MKLWRDVVGYLVIGGLILGMVLRSYEDKCHVQMPVSNADAAMTMLLWPAMVAVALVIPKHEVLCDYKPS